MAINLSSKERFPTIVDGVKYNVYIEYPDTVTEICTYKLQTKTMFMATITYSDATKEQIVSVEWS